jgi:coenzyme F420-reducing hydrogenase beta subunit
MTHKASIAARIEIALFCLPNAPYREMMRVLFEDMTAEYDVQSKAADYWMTEANKEHNNGVRLEDATAIEGATNE